MEKIIEIKIIKLENVVWTITYQKDNCCFYLTISIIVDVLSEAAVSQLYNDIHWKDINDLKIHFY